LPSEEQWELAARGEERRPYPWGASPPDLSRTMVYQGAGVTPGAVMASDQDQTPAAAGEAIYDLMGNAQEWSRDALCATGPCVEQAREAYRTSFPLHAHGGDEGAVSPLMRSRHSLTVLKTDDSRLRSSHCTTDVGALPPCGLRPL